MNSDPLANTTGRSAGRALVTGSGQEDIVVQALKDCQAAIDAGKDIDRAAMLEKYPDIRDELSACLDGLELMRRPASNDSGPLAERSTHSPISPLATLGDFRIVREIGRGGMGLVYEAEQLSIGRRVALKVLPYAAMLDKQQIARFQNEVRAAATLEHPHIVPVYFVGNERGVYYYAMRLINGKNLAEIMDELHRDDAKDPLLSQIASQLTGLLDPKPEAFSNPASASAETVRFAAAESTRIATDHGTRENTYYESIARLGKQAAEALDFAHGHGIIHRDIKPANIMLDEVGDAWIADFGLARIESDGGMTMTGDLVGTLRYMSPEQTLAKRLTVDHRSDVYSLGATLYEMLTLRPMFESDDRATLIHQITFDDPKPPSKVRRGVPRDLEAVVLKAIEKDPDDRYATAKEFGDDLMRFLEHRPVHAKPPSFLDRMRKWSRRHRRLSLVAFAALAITVICLATTTILVGGALQETRKAQRQVVGQRDIALSNLYVATVRLAQDELEHGSATAGLDLLSGLLPQDGSPDLRGWEWHYLQSLCHRDEFTFRGHTGTVHSVAWSPDGNYLASAGGDQTVRIWDVTKEREIKKFQHANEVLSVNWSPTGNEVVSSTKAGAIHIWNVSTGEQTRRISSKGRIQQVSFDKTGSYLACCNYDSMITLFKPSTGEAIRELKGAARTLAWRPDGKLLASGSGYTDRLLRIWNPEDGSISAEHAIADSDAIMSVGWSPDGLQLASTGYDQRVRIWDASDLIHRLTIDPNVGRIRSLSWSPDGEEIAIAGGDGSVTTWSSQDGSENILASSTGKMTGRMIGHLGRVNSVDWSPDGNLLASGSTDNTVKIWKPRRAFASRSTDSRANTGFSADGKFVAVTGTDGKIYKMNVRTGVVDDSHPFNFSHPNIKPRFLDWSPNGLHLACAGASEPGKGKRIDRVVNVFDIVTRQTLRVFSIPSQSGEIRGIAWSPDGAMLAAAMFGKDIAVKAGNVVVWDIASGKEVARLEHPNTDCAVWSPDGKRLAVSCWNQKVKVWDTNTWKIVMELNRDPTGSSAAAGNHVLSWSPDGKLLAGGTSKGWVIIWDSKSGREVSSFYGHREIVRSLAFSPDGKRLVSGSMDRTMKLWTLDGQLLLNLGHSNTVNSVGWTPDQKRIISQDYKELKVWSAEAQASH